jgi:uncharacterized membrane protein
MKAAVKLIGVGLLVAIAAHVATIAVMPSVIMNIALKRIAEVSGGVNKLNHAPMVTPDNQRIVRSSPDLAYSTCVLDLTGGPIRIFIGKGADYSSAAFYAANTDNLIAINDRNVTGDGAHILVVSPQVSGIPKPGEQIVTLPSNKGLLLVRRLSPSADAYARVDQERAKDQCARAS